MKKSLSGLVTLMLMAAPAYAHTEMGMTEPANGAVLDAVPDALDLRFMAPARLMKVEMIHSNGDTAHTVAIDIPTREMVESIRLVPDFMGAGAYDVQWRALSVDGHVINDSFSFTVVGE
ncbi:MAG: copper resistance protein CopC [Hyphomicrobiales bacterium]